MRLTSNEIFYLNALNSISGVDARDCVVDDNAIAFLVKKEAMGKAIGKNASKIKELKKKLRKNVEIFEYTEGIESFIKNALYNIKIEEIKIVEKNGKKQAILMLDPENKRKLLNSLPRIKRIKALSKRDYNIEDIRTR
ncbi:MAG: NusA-like transcription termination signal-binding factor [Candidatus Diapherotrites archaeon]|uniref:NusA-like transcription termination signal-binding factor n=1 Tax=Candidatus Iainarchaeum sp. TaxID=3101447 RepID=A0A938YNA0_9ARCH|nr:NusA-like transcription termination signal-binding factor [Candidatus Diapherotrites archaeon]